MSSKNLSIKLKIDAHGNVSGVLNKATKSTDKFGKSAKKASVETDKMTASIKRVGYYAAGAFATHQLLGFAKAAVLTADKFNILQQRIKTATKATHDYARVSADLFQISQQTGSALESNVILFQSLARIAPELGATNAQMLSMTKSLQQLGTIGGSTGVQMSNAMLQFGQAMAGGVMRAEEFNSIIENTPEIASRIALGMGKTVGQLRMAVLEGEVLSEDVFNALAKQADSINEEFSKMPLTIGQATQSLDNSFSALAGTIDDGFGITDTLALTFKDLSLAIDDNVVSAEQFTANVRTMKFYATTAVNAIRMEVNDLVDSFTALGLKAILTYEILNTEVSLNTFDDIRDKINAYNAAIEKLYSDNKSFDDSLKQSALLSRYAGVKNQLIDLGQEFKIQEENAKKLNKQTNQVFESKNLKQIEADKKQQLKDQLAAEKQWLKSVKEYHEEYRAELEADAEAIEKAQKATEKWGKEQGRVGDKHNDEISNLVLDIDNMGDAWTRTGDKASQAITSMLKMSMDYANQTSQLSDNQEKIDNLRFENLDKFSLKQININEFKENESKLSELQGKIDKEKSDKNIAYYAGLAGAISNAYETGSKEALAFQTIQQGLALYDGIRAVINAWSAPYPLNLVQVPLTTASVGALLSQMGTSFSGGSAPSAVAKQAETGSGVLGGGVSNSIENSMDYMDSIQADQYSELRGIHEQTKLLNSSIGNAVATLFRTDEFHNMGTGYSATLENGLMNAMSEGVFNTMTLGVFQGLGSSVGDITNSIMGGRIKANQSDYGVSATGTMGQTGLSGYSDVKYKKDGGWFGKNKKWTETSYSQLQASSQNSLNLIFDSMSNQAIEYGKALDMNISSQVANTEIVIGKISGTGSAEEVQKRYTEAFNKQSDHLIDTVFGNVIEEYRKMGEASAETLNRLIVNKVAVEDILAMTNQRVVGDVVALADSLVTLAGGLNELKQSADSYYEHFYSDTEKSARNQALLTDALSSQGLVLAESRAEYRRQFEAINSVTRVGKEQIVTMLAQADAADAYYDVLEQRQADLLNEQLDSVNNVISGLQSLNQSLTSTFDKLVGSVTADSATYMQAQATVFDALNEARNGNLPELDSIRQALNVISSNDINNYATAEAFNFEQKLMANAVAELIEITGIQETYEDKSLALLEAIKDGVTLKNSNLINSISDGFSVLDANQDNAISYAEFQNTFSNFATSTEMQAMFDGLDLNRDGVLTVAELNKHTPLLTNIDTSTAIANATNTELKKVIASNGGNTSGLVSGAGPLESRTLAQLMRTALAIKSSESVWSNSEMAQSYRNTFTSEYLFETDNEAMKRDYINWIRTHGLDGSHATGLANVPFDDYRANLHKGEAVIDARTMQGMRKYGIASNSSSNAKLEQLLNSINNKLDNLKSDDDSKHQIVSSLVDIKDTLEEWNVVGMPAPQDQLQ